MKKILMTVLFFVVTRDVFAIPTLTEASSTGTTFKFATKLSEKLPTGYKVKIDLNNGKGLVAMTCSGLTCSLSSNALPKLDSLTYKIGIYDAKGVLQGAMIDGSYVIVSTATSGYTKISNSGAVLPYSAKLGSGDNDWACTKDNKTGLTWEVKTDDGGLRDKDWYYSWYKPSGDNGGSVGFTDITYTTPNCSTKDNCNTYAFTNAVNTKELCGKNDWRMPTKDELMKLVVCSDGKYDKDGFCTNITGSTPTINSTYFPNTLDRGYWSSSPFANLSSYAWYVRFSYGFSNYYHKSTSYFVRLVRDAQPPITTAYTKISNSGTSLPDTAALGSGPNDWACTKDNKTGLVWEVKTTDGGLRDYNNTYSWYEPDASKNDGNAGYKNIGNCKGSQCDTYAFTNAVNAQGLCGKNDWRMPTMDELKGLLTTKSTINQPTNLNIYIDANYLPNTSYGYWYWSSSSSPGADYSSYAWSVSFYYGYSYLDDKYVKKFVRLVR